MDGNLQSGKVAIFGFKDSLVGQVLEMLKQHTKYEVEFFISIKPLSQFDIETEHLTRPNRKTEFIKDMKIFGKSVFYEPNFIDLLKREHINKVFILEDDGWTRSKIFKVLQSHKIQVLSFFHPTTVFAGHNTLGHGVIIFPQCYIGYKTDIKDNVIIQSKSTIEHHNVVNDFVNINTNLTTGGFTFIDKYAEINISVDIINRIKIGKGCRIGAGSLVMDDCKEGGLYFGRPAKYVRVNNKYSMYKLCDS